MWRTFFWHSLFVLGIVIITGPKNLQFYITAARSYGLPSRELPVGSAICEYTAGGGLNWQQLVRISSLMAAVAFYHTDCLLADSPPSLLALTGAHLRRCLFSSYFYSLELVNSRILLDTSPVSSLERSWPSWRTTFDPIGDKFNTAACDQMVVSWACSEIGLAEFVSEVPTAAFVNLSLCRSGWCKWSPVRFVLTYSC